MHACMQCMALTVLYIASHICIAPKIKGNLNRLVLQCNSFVLVFQSQMEEDGMEESVMDKDVEKPENWKSKLSSAFNEDEIFYSLLILGNFYVVYAIVKSSFDVYDNSADDEQRFIQSCFCSFNQRFIFRFLFYFCLVLWFIIHSYNFFVQLSVKRLQICEDFIKVFLAFCIVCPCYSLCGICKYLHKHLYKCITRYHELNPSTSGTDRPVNSVNHNKLIQKNLKLLWFQYCKLYVIGYTMYDDDKIQSIKSIMKNENEENNGGNSAQDRSCCFIECKKKGENASYDCHCFRCNEQPINTCPEINMMCCNEYFPNRCLSQDIICVILFFVKYIAQLVTVPLLLLQIFDTYSFLCFSPDSYCSHTTEYQQHLVQAAITLFFYCSLVISHLASTMLIWNPWPKPKHDEKRKLALENVIKQNKLKQCMDSRPCTSKYRLCAAIRNKFEETFNDKHPWTIYFLLDLKVVYIITFGLITIINLISSTANIHAFTDKNCMVLFNVSSNYMNVNVTSINDPILWNCRGFSETSDSYKFLYWMVIITLIVIMTGWFLIKFVSLIVVNSGCGFKCCSNMSSTFKHGLTKLWYMAIHQEIILKIHPNQEATEHGILSQSDIGFYDDRLNEDIPDDVVKNLSYKNYFRSTIPYILLVLSFTILCLAYFSFDLHPLACIAEPDEELITYEMSKVELKFSTSLLLYQKIGGISVFFLSIVFLTFVRLFFYYTELVVKDLKKQVKSIREAHEKKAVQNERAITINENPNT